MTTRAIVLGARGFVGTAVCHELVLRGWEVTALAAPRVAGGMARARAEAVDALAAALDGVDAVVNAAGLAKPAGHDLAAFNSANAALPRLVFDACALAQVGRLVHISSAAVQGSLSPLDESPRYLAESPYARTKMLGEQALLAGAATDQPGRTVMLRPTSVHGPSRPVTRQLVRLARSPLASVVAPGAAPTPQVLVENVGAAAEYLCRPGLTPPRIVLQPWEGWTTGAFLQLLSGRWPHQMSATTAGSVLRVGRVMCGRGSRLAYQRRLEILWCGQAQVRGWLADVGFSSPYGRERWERLAHDLGGGGQ